MRIGCTARPACFQESPSRRQGGCRGRQSEAEGGRGRRQREAGRPGDQERERESWERGRSRAEAPAFVEGLFGMPKQAPRAVEAPE